jgi:hypothetical protein
MSVLPMNHLQTVQSCHSEKELGKFPSTARLLCYNFKLNGSLVKGLFTVKEIIMGGLERVE